MNKSKVVIGLGFGDEGKGLTTSYLCSKVDNPLVIRFSGGHQAGHTVVYDGVRHVFSNLGSGTLQNVPTYWSEYCTFEPIGFGNEVSDLNSKMDISNIKMYLNRYCPVTTPYDIYANQIHEKKFGHGSVGVGFGKTLERDEVLPLRVTDFEHPKVLEMKLEAVREYYGVEQMKNKEDYFLWSAMNLMEGVFDGAVKLVDELPKGFDYIAEGSQGLLLDQDYGFFPHVTRSNVGMKRVHMLPLYDCEIWYVTRAYQTRHGNGPMTNEKQKDYLQLKNNENETNVSNEYQGSLRVAPLDLELLHYSLVRDSEDFFDERVERKLVITCMDQLDEYPFTNNGELFNVTREEFLETVSRKLGFKEEDIYLSDSPDSTLNQITK